MLSCGEVENLLSAYYDGELGVAASAQVERHLSECEECRKKLDDIRSISSLLLEREVLEADDSFKITLSEKLLSEVKKNKKRYAFFGAKNIKAFASLAACLVVFVGVYAAFDNDYLSSKEPDIALTGYEENLLETAEDENEKEALENTTEKALPPAQISEMGQNVYARVRVAENKKQENTGMGKATEVMPDQPQPIEPDENEASDLAKETQTQTQISPASIENNSETEILVEDEPENRDENEPESKTEKDDAEDDTEQTNSIFTSAVARFKLSDPALRETVIELLKQYGEPKTDEKHIMIEVLGANYEACIDALSEIDGVDKYIVDVYEGSKYCYIQIEI